MFIYRYAIFSRSRHFVNRKYVTETRTPVHITTTYTNNVRHFYQLCSVVLHAWQEKKRKKGSSREDLQITSGTRQPRNERERPAGVPRTCYVYIYI